MQDNRVARASACGRTRTTVSIASRRPPKSDVAWPRTTRSRPYYAPGLQTPSIVSSDRLNPLRLRLASLQVRSRQSNLSDDIASRTTERRRTAHRVIDNGPTVNQTAASGPVDLSLGHDPRQGGASADSVLFSGDACAGRRNRSFNGTASQVGGKAE
jgi:hypothetical protein